MMENFLFSNFVESLSGVKTPGYFCCIITSMDYFAAAIRRRGERRDLTKNVRLSGLAGEGKLIGILEIYIETLLFLQRRNEGKDGGHNVNTNNQNKQINF